jgi:hypothetical protein
MSHATSSSSSPANFDSIFNSALDVYKRRTKQDLTSHPLLPTLQACDSPDAVLEVLREQIPSFSQSRNPDDGLTKWLVPAVNVILGFSAALGEGVGLVNIRTSPCENGFSNHIRFIGIPTSESDLCRRRSSPRGPYSSLFPRHGMM